MQVVPYKDSTESKKKQVSEMFNGISGQYDQMNRLITFGVDLRWRKRLIEKVASLSPKNVLDVATGTGDLALAIARETQAQVIGLDISAGMLAVGAEKIKTAHLQQRVDMILGDSESIAFEDNRFDVVTVAFGVRNFEHLERGLLEIKRVLKPGGTLAVLETSVPTNPFFKLGYLMHTRLMLPLISKLFATDKRAYSYLVASASSFPYNESFTAILKKVGFSTAQYKQQTFGAACIYYAKK
ncbi:MAG: bifunctional demethylmenaquinone methyltransferase/2-methoxy-6-polyprenyl-1,4-benzoquinol methylase UbiE [Flavobacteriaceae bacterium]